MNRAILLVLLALGWARAPGWAQTDDQKVHFDLVKGYLIVAQCSIGSVTHLKAIIDTGASTTVLDSRLVRWLSLATAADSATFATQDAKVRSVVAPSLTLGPIKSGPLSVISADLSDFAAQAGTNIDVIIGMDLLRASDFVIDYDARVMQFAPVAAMRHHAAMENLAGLTTVSVTGLGHPLTLLVDSGFSGLLVFKGRLGQKVRMRDAALKLSTVGGMENLEEFEAATVQIGDWQAPGKKLLMTKDDRQEPAEFDGLLGPRFLGAGRVAFDFHNHMLWWEESAQTGR